MFILSWCSRRVGGLSLLLLLFLCCWIISGDLSENRARLRWTQKLPGDIPSEEGNREATHFPKTTIFFACYSLLIHTLVAIFPFRACWATFDITHSLRRIARLKKYKNSKHRRSSSDSSNSSNSSASQFSTADTLTPTRSVMSSASSDAGAEIDCGYVADVEKDSSKNIHAILIPNYKEEIDVLEETLRVLASHPTARAQYDVSQVYE
jgi:hypothetical protein